MPTTNQPRPFLDKAAKLAFNAYNDAGANPGKTFDGRPVPSWENLNDDVRAKWVAAEKPVRSIPGSGISRYADPDYGVVCYATFNGLSCVKIEAFDAGVAVGVRFKL